MISKNLLHQNRLNTSHSRWTRFFFLDFEFSYLFGILDMRTTTELARICDTIRTHHSIYFYDIRILFPECSLHSWVLGFCFIHICHCHDESRINGLIYIVLHSLDLFRSHLLRMSEIKSESLRCDIRSCLMHSTSEHLTKTSKHQMTSRVKCCCLSSIISQSTLEFPCRSGTRELLVFFECDIESIYIYRKSLLFCELNCHLKRKSIRIKKCKCFSTRNLSHLLTTSLECNLESIHNLFKLSNPILESFTKLPFFNTEFILDFFCIITNTFIDSRELHDIHICNHTRKWELISHLIRLTDSTTDETTENITLIHILGSNTIRDHMSSTTKMISYDTCWSLDIIRFSDNLSDFLEDWSKEICLIDRLHLIECHSTSLDSHTGIHTLCRQILECIRINTIILHEDIIPDLHPIRTICSLIWSMRRFPFTHPIEYLSIWTTRTRRTSCPPVILCRQIGNLIYRHTDRFPDICRFFITRSIDITLKYCERDHLWIKSEPILARQELPTHLDRFTLEIITEWPVSKHLEKCTMGIITNIIDVPGSYTLLYIDESLSKWMRFSKKVWNEWLHTCSIEEYGWIILRNKWCRWDNCMILGLEEFEIFVADFWCEDSRHKQMKKIYSQSIRKNQKNPLKNWWERLIYLYKNKNNDILESINRIINRVHTLSPFSSPKK